MNFVEYSKMSMFAKSKDISASNNACLTWDISEEEVSQAVQIGLWKI